MLSDLPAPLPEYFLIGFDLQKFEAEGIPRHFLDPDAPEGEIIGYPVYLDGSLQSSGWWYYYLAALAYKVPEGTWGLLVLGLVVLAISPRSRATWADELAVGIVPLTVLVVMSFGTDINLGLRYILPAFPYLFIATGKVAPWVAGLVPPIRRQVAIVGVAGCLGANVLAVALIHPHYLAYFNWASGGAAHGSEHLIDSNLDWGQDLVNLRDWLRENAPGERVGLAYFGQINPNLLKLRELAYDMPGEGFDWFLAPALPGTIRPMNPSWPVDGSPARLEPGLYAVSASFVRGLPYSIYDSSMRIPNLYPAWDTRNTGSSRPAFGYFSQLEPIAKVGDSIFLYRVTPDVANRIAPLWDSAR